VCIERSNNTHAGADRMTTSDATGAFQLAGLRLAGFTVRFRHDGYDSRPEHRHLQRHGVVHRDRQAEMNRAGTRRPCHLMLPET
jgi:hypothetical protein